MIGIAIAATKHSSPRKEARYADHTRIDFQYVVVCKYVSFQTRFFSRNRAVCPKDENQLCE